MVFAVVVPALATPDELVFTVMFPLVPVIEEVTVSVLVIVREPTVFKVALKVPTPLVNVESEGGTACASLLVKCAVPA